MTRSVEDYIANLHAGQAGVVRALCEVIRRAAPEARESIKWAQPVWEVNGPVCSVKAFRSYSNVNFWRGAELAERGDPQGLLLGETLRALDDGEWLEILDEQGRSRTTAPSSARGGFTRRAGAAAVGLDARRQPDAPSQSRDRRRD